MANPASTRPESLLPPSGPGVPRARALLLDDVRFDKHASRAYHPERPERLVAARAALHGCGADWLPVAAREATADELVRVHDASFVEGLEKLRGAQGFLDADTYISPDSVDAARLAAGGVIEMVDALLDGPTTLGVALPRPPGHHARPSRAMGFCLLNNVAVAAAHARARGVSRIAVIDWDVHHGNGTQEIFYKDANILYASLHQFPFYPGTGAAHETGVGEGHGYTVNIPIAAHGDDSIYRGAFERVLLPVLDEYAPELVLVSAGFDASARDPLAQMELTPAAFYWMSAALEKVAAKHAKGKMALVLEGGYDLVALESGLRSAIRGMLAPHRDETPTASRTSVPPVPIASNVDNEDVARAAAEAKNAWPIVS